MTTWKSYGIRIFSYPNLGFPDFDQKRSKSIVFVIKNARFFATWKMVEKSRSGGWWKFNIFWLRILLKNCNFRLVVRRGLFQASNDRFSLRRTELNRNRIELHWIEIELIWNQIEFKLNWNDLNWNWNWIELNVIDLKLNLFDIEMKLIWNRIELILVDVEFESVFIIWNWIAFELKLMWNLKLNWIWIEVEIEIKWVELNSVDFQSNLIELKLNRFNLKLKWLEII